MKVIKKILLGLSILTLVSNLNLKSMGENPDSNKNKSTNSGNHRKRKRKDNDDGRPVTKQAKPSEEDQKEIDRRKQIIDSISFADLERIGHDTRIHEHEKSELTNLSETTREEFEATIQHVQNILRAEALMQECIGQLQLISQELNNKLEVLHVLVSKNDLDGSKKIYEEMSVLVSKAMDRGGQYAMKVQSFCAYETEKMKKCKEEIDELVVAHNGFLSKSSGMIKKTVVNSEDIEMGEAQDLDSGVNTEKINILARRLKRLTKYLGRIVEQGDNPLRTKIIAGKILSGLRSGFKNLDFHVQRNSSLRNFYADLNKFKEDFFSYEIDRALSILADSEPDNLEVKKAIYQNKKIKNLFERDFSQENDFSYMSDSEDESLPSEEDEIEMIFKREELIQSIRNGEKDLVGIDLSGESLKGVDFSGANLTNANFRNADLTGAIFTDADLTGVKFDRAILDNTNLSRANLTNTDFTNFREWKDVNLNGVKMAKGAKMPGIKLIGTEFAEEVDFTDAILTGAIFNKVNLKKAIFKNTDLRDSVLFDPDLDFAQFINADLSGAKISGSGMYKDLNDKYNNGQKGITGMKIIDNTRLFGAFLCNLHIKESVLSNISFYAREHTHNSRLKSIIFDKCTLSNINMIEIVGSKVQFIKSDLKTIDFSGCSLEYFTFSENGCLGKNLKFREATIRNSHFIGEIIDNYDARFNEGRTEGIGIEYETASLKLLVAMEKFIEENLDNEDKRKTNPLSGPLLICAGIEKFLTPLFSDLVWNKMLGRSQFLNFENINSFLDNCDFSEVSMNNVFFTNIKFIEPTNFLNITSAKGTIFHNVIIGCCKSSALLVTKTNKRVRKLMYLGAKVNSRISDKHAPFWSAHPGLGDEVNKISQAIGIVASVASLVALFP